MLSTDKAVYPINAMGMSKGLMEKVMIARSRIAGSKTLICGTRYGNVMASRGSVIPVLIEQIKKNKDITVTDGTMTRFMMSLGDAVTLVNYAFKNAKQGDLFVMKAPATNMLLLAEVLKQIFKSKSKIKFIGIRHGEKNFETLVNREERFHSIENKNYFRIVPDKRSLNYESYHSSGKEKIIKYEEYTSKNTKQLDKKELTKLLLSLDEVKKKRSKINKNIIILGSKGMLGKNVNYYFQKKYKLILINTKITPRNLNSVIGLINKKKSIIFNCIGAIPQKK